MDAPAWEDPRRVLARHGLKPKRGYSQNFLVAQHAVERIAAAAITKPGERVVELGPGLGTLTGALLRAGGRVTGLDADPDMLAVLRQELGDCEALTLEHGDAAQLDLAPHAEGGPIAVAGNLPYAVTGAILRRLVEQRQHLSRAVVMVQKEVRDRLLATPGNKTYGALTVFTQGTFEVHSEFTLSPGCFFPPPKVDSAVVRLTPLTTPRALERPSLRTVVRAAFDARRKTLRNALGRVQGAAHAEQVLEAAGIDGRRRGETLSVEEFEGLAVQWELAAGG